MADNGAAATITGYKTPLYDTHIRLGAKVIEFGGWLMPVQYSGIIEEHKAVRTAAGLFDLSHMGEFEVKGYQTEEFLQYATSNDVTKLAEGQAQYNLMLYPDGGIVDDLIIYHRSDKYLLVVNAANIDEDLDWLNETRMIKGSEAVLRNVSYATALLSVQGPKSLEILQPLTDINLSEIAYYHCAEGQINEVKVLFARTGYTGEDGFELFFPRTKAVEMWELLMEAGKGKGMLPVGLGARDTLRLEAKMALYGNDIDGTINPLEAGLSWVVKFDKGNFTGRDILLAKKKKGVTRNLVGFEMTGRGIARHGYPVAKDGKTIGTVTSGAPSPTLGKNIGLALVPPENSEIGSKFDIMIRDQPVEAVVVKTPFYTRKK